MFSKIKDLYTKPLVLLLSLLLSINSAETAHLQMEFKYTSHDENLGDVEGFLQGLNVRIFRHPIYI